MKYAVTFCVLDREAGSNPFWHSCLLLSQWEDKGKIEVVEQWGFYGLPTTTPNSLLKKVKLSLGLDVDLNGNHGMLRHEELRFLDLGCGLRGATFELSEEKFKLLQQRCKVAVDEQEQAINEVMNQQGLAAKAKKDTRIYPYEHWSAQIYQFEKAKAQEQNRESRLKPFELNLSLTLWGPSLKGSYTCKTQALSLLKGILTEQQLSRLTENDKHPTLPLYSGPLEKIFLHSAGPLRQHTKRSGKKVHYRALEDKDVKLYWTLPPQEMEVLSEETNKSLQISKDYADEAKLVIRRLQRLEWLFRNATLPDIYQSYREQLIEQICDYYDAFAQINTMQSPPLNDNSWFSYLSFLGAVPRNKGEQALLKQVQHAKMLLNSLYMAVVDQWQIDLNYPFERYKRTSNKQFSKEEMDNTADVNLFNKENSSNTDMTMPLTNQATASINYVNALEAVASYLNLEDKKELCNILGRPYIATENKNNEVNQEVNFSMN
ncbi:Uncharacterised protein [Legionella busanensis]|uniref:Uncharacterized protein n=1 Tax=Legionella busanensis TaxID=190655 RepID=A0A378JKB2_9GAMM|nr:hypothetical protein [Legionella busanensis]STX50659.1 Uncharacterised protein [Legionella busanensis]